MSDILINIEGGIPDVVRLPKGTTLTIVDYDVDGFDAEDLSEDKNGRPCTVKEYE